MRRAPGDAMRIRGFVLPIVIIAALIAMGGIMAGLMVGRDHAPQTSVSEASVSPTKTPLATDTLSNHPEYKATHAGWLEQDSPGQKREGTGGQKNRALQPSLEPAKTVEKNSAGTARNGALAIGVSGDIIRMQDQHTFGAGGAIQSKSEGGPAGLTETSTEGAEVETKDVDQGQEQAIPLLDKPELTYPNLGSHLNQLVTSVEEEKAAAENAASSGTVQREGSVAVTIYLSGNVEEVVSFLEVSGADPRNVGEDYIEAYVPASLLGPVSERPEVIRVREIIPPKSEGSG